MNEQKQRIIIHIGPIKTGSTALQNTLVKYQPFINSNSILYLESLGYGVKENHNLLLLGAVDSSVVGPGAWGYARKAKLSAQEIFEREKAFIQKQISGSNFNSVILSGENLFVPFSQLGIDFWSGLFPFENSELEFVSYYRDPADRFASAVQQFVKLNHVLDFPPSYLHMRPVLEEIENFYPNKCVVKCFETLRRNKGDITRDFLSHVSPEIDLTSIASVSANETMSAEASALLQEYRQRHYSESDGDHQRDVDSFLWELTKLGEKGSKAQKPQLRPAIKNWIYAYFAADIEWMAEHYDVDISKYRDHPSRVGADEFDMTALKEVRDIFEVDEQRLSEIRAALPKWCFGHPVRRRWKMVGKPKAWRSIRRRLPI